MKKIIPIAILGIAMLCSTNVFAETNYFAELEKDLVDNTLTIKAENPKLYNASNGNTYAEIIIGMIHQKYHLGYNVKDNSYDSVGVYGHFNDDYTQMTFTKDACNYIEGIDQETGRPYSTSECISPIDIKTIKTKFTGINNAIKQKIIDSASSVYAYNDTNYSNHKEYVVEDLSFINYLVNSSCDIDNTDGYVCHSNELINYSEEYKKHVANKNISIVVDNRAGDCGGGFISGTMGVGGIMYNGYLYGSYWDVEGKINQVIYIPEDTADTHEAYIAAAKSRINNYFRNTNFQNKIDINFAGSISDLTSQQYDDLGLHESEYYTIIYEGKYYNLLIHKDNSKIKNPIFETVDVDTNIAHYDRSTEETKQIVTFCNSVFGKEGKFPIDQFVGIMESYMMSLVIEMWFYAGELGADIGNPDPAVAVFMDVNRQELLEMMKEIILAL